MRGAGAAPGDPAETFLTDVQLRSEGSCRRGGSGDVGALSPTLVGEPAKQPEERSEEGMGLQSGTVAPPQGAINLAPTPP
jgi:hypothetical protein